MNKSSVPFENGVVNKKQLQKLIYKTFHNYGIIKSALIADRLKNLTFHYATISGISLSVEDLRVPYTKRNLIGLTTDEIKLTESVYSCGKITAVERFQKVIDIWNNANNSLKDEVLSYFRESDPLNPLYIMAFSGARGNVSQVRQLVGMRGLMADPQGQIIDLPIKSNFREGLKVTEYIISSYGARKGLVDTALRTADSGYLTRRLVDVAQDIIVREEDCLTTDGLTFDDLSLNNSDFNLNEKITGRLLAKPLKISGENIIIPANTELGLSLVNKIEKYAIKDFEIRSPLTCNALRSVCRKCYGWHLSYSKLIDLGEAIGILAAQSIGEPGTQLTMRTFHTGGVFSGDLTKQIRAPFNGTVTYKLNYPAKLIRTIHGEKGFILFEETKLFVTNLKGTTVSLTVPVETLLLVSNNQKVYKDQILVEIKKDNNLIFERDQRNIYSDECGEVFLQNLKVSEKIDGEGTEKKVCQSSGSIWVLNGQKYTLINSAKLGLCIGDNFKKNDTIAYQKIFNNYSGIVDLSKLKSKAEINIVNSSLLIDNCNVTKTNQGYDNLTLFTKNTNKVFTLCFKPGDNLKHGQTIASLNETTYQTASGGILHYSIQNNTTKKLTTLNKKFNGSLYFIPEETHSLKQNNHEFLKIKEGYFIRKGYKLFSNVRANISGFVHFTEDNLELCIKPGELYLVSALRKLPNKNLVNRFIKPGEEFLPQIFAQRLSYLENIELNDKKYVLLRPVITYTVPQEKGFTMQHKFFPNQNRRNALFRTVKRIFYKDGERIILAKGGTNLLKTFLVLDIKEGYRDLNAIMEYKPTFGTWDKRKEKLKLSLTLYEDIQLKLILGQGSHENKIIKTQIKNNQYIKPKTLLAKIETLAQTSGQLISVQKTNTLDILILEKKNLKKCFYNEKKKNLIVKEGDLINKGTYLTNNVRSKYTGQVYKIEDNVIEIRLGRPYLVSTGTILRKASKALVEKSDILATLVYEKLKTVDIVQGLPKVEEILEARKIKNGCILAPHEGEAFLNKGKIEIIKPDGTSLVLDKLITQKVNFTNGKKINFLEKLTDGPISPHEKLDILFSYYSEKYSPHQACKLSFRYLQLFLVNEVQRTYLSQGVQIADKHIEIIVKQMTSKVRIFYGGDTTLLPGEILDINQAEIIANTTISTGEKPPLYRPLLLGLTKASLNSESFISAASFQETTRVLTEAAIEGKKDWLNGLKENVIIGRLIPAGTGFNCFENLKKINEQTRNNLFIKPSREGTNSSHILKERILNDTNTQE